MGSVCMWEGYKRVWEGEGEVVHICREERHGGSDSQGDMCNRRESGRGRSIEGCRGVEKEKWKLEAQLNAGGKDEVTEMKTRERDRGHICVKRNCRGRQKMVSATGWVLSQIAYLIKAYLTEEKTRLELKTVTIIVKNLHLISNLNLSRI